MCKDGDLQTLIVLALTLHFSFSHHQFNIQTATCSCTLVISSRLYSSLCAEILLQFSNKIFQHCFVAHIPEKFLQKLHSPYFHLYSSRWRYSSTLTHKIPHKHSLLEEPGWLEAVVEKLFESCHQAVLSTQQDSQASPLHQHTQTKKTAGKTCDLHTGMSYNKNNGNYY